MKRSIFYLLMLLFISACQQEEKGKENDRLSGQLDSIQKELTQLRKELKEQKKEPVKDSIVKKFSLIPVKDSLIKKRKNTEKSPIKRDVVTTKKEEDTTFFYYVKSKKISAYFTPWKDERRKLLMFSPDGTLTFEQEDVRLSYQSNTDIKEFHSNGAISQIHIHMNPGASMYWYETTITFGINNEPEWKTQMKHPASLEDHMNSKFWWDTKEKTWKKQEYIKEQPVQKN